MQPTARPWILVLGGPGFRREIPYPTREAVYATAVHERDIAIADEISPLAHARVVGIRILHHDPDTGHRYVHARSWRLPNPAPDALQPIADPWIPTA